jgi:hypothetical protein
VRRFRDPWGNRVQVVQYDEIRYTKAPEVLRGMGLDVLAQQPGNRTAALTSTGDVDPIVGRDQELALAGAFADGLGDGPRALDLGADQ